MSKATVRTDSRYYDEAMGAMLAATTARIELINNGSEQAKATLVLWDEGFRRIIAKRKEEGALIRLQYSDVVQRSNLYKIADELADRDTISLADQCGFIS